MSCTEMRYLVLAYISQPEHNAYLLPNFGSLFLLLQHPALPPLCFLPFLSLRSLSRFLLSLPHSFRFIFLLLLQPPLLASPYFPLPLLLLSPSPLSLSLLFPLFPSLIPLFSRLQRPLLPLHLPPFWLPLLVLSYLCLRGRPCTNYTSHPDS
ncbi:hypothetical protein BDV93DRAFT_589878 [Ceratobasidium sp. AG-I]|nr:hypothetical protein BDV93DRAFT_589878 [Ceratobasidium sp. AG-I]